MSGICGIYSPRDPSLASRALIERMLAAMENRGGNGERVAQLAAGVAIGLTSRNAFLGPHEESRDPWLEDSTRVIALDGSIHDSLLADHGKNEPNTAAVAASLQAGTFPDSLDGVYSAAVWDAERHELRLAADSLGSKTLYYYHSAASGAVAFASRLDALVECSVVPREIDLSSVHVYLARGSIFAPYTIYRDVRKLLPGEVLTIGDDGVLHSRIYHRQTAAPRLELPSSELAPLLRSEMTGALARTTRGGQRLGVLLSSGVDSAVMLAALRDAGAGCVAYTLVYDTTPSMDESPQAAAAAGAAGVEHRIVRVGNMPDSVLSQMFDAYDEPIDLSRGPTNYFLAQAMAADSIFAGLNGIAGENVYGGMEWRGFAAARRETGSDMEAVDRLLSGASMLDAASQDAILTTPVDAVLLRERILKPFERLVEIDDPYERYNAALLLRIPTGRHGVSPSAVPHIFGVEQRQGLRDQRLMDFGRTLPFEEKEGGSFNTSRRLVRGAYAGRYPHLLDDSPKHGMPALPWRRLDFNGIDRYIAPALERLKGSGLVRPVAIDRILSKYASPGRSNRAITRARALFSLQSWIDVKIEKRHPFS